MKRHHAVLIRIQVCGMESYIQCHLNTILLTFFYQTNYFTWISLLGLYEYNAAFYKEVKLKRGVELKWHALHYKEVKQSHFYMSISHNCYI